MLISLAAAIDYKLVFQTTLELALLTIVPLYWEKKLIGHWKPTESAVCCRLARLTGSISEMKPELAREVKKQVPLSFDVSDVAALITHFESFTQLSHGKSQFSSWQYGRERERNQMHILHVRIEK